MEHNVYCLWIYDACLNFKSEPGNGLNCRLVVYETWQSVGLLERFITSAVHSPILVAHTYTLMYICKLVKFLDEELCHAN